MNREIKFRGLASYQEFCKKKKRIVKKTKWVYGSVVFGGGGKFPKTAQIWDEEGHNYSVDPKTVGQYIGLKDKNGKDKNGKEIYEGDICEIKFNVDDVEDYIYLTLSKEEKKTGTKKFIVDSPLFNNQVEFCSEEIEVIGNKFENKELLKQKYEHASR